MGAGPSVRLLPPSDSSLRPGRSVSATGVDRCHQNVVSLRQKAHDTYLFQMVHQVPLPPPISLLLLLLLVKPSPPLARYSIRYYFVWNGGSCVLHCASSELDARHYPNYLWILNLALMDWYALSARLIFILGVLCVNGYLRSTTDCWLLRWPLNDGQLVDGCFQSSSSSKCRGGAASAAAAVNGATFWWLNDCPKFVSMSWTCSWNQWIWTMLIIHSFEAGLLSRHCK